jgi:3-deoxy-D-manno-octulosonic acid (KDO) 8-phosphate synthase
MEVHEDPSRALSDGATSLSLAELPGLLEALRSIDRAVREGGHARVS